MIEYIVYRKKKYPVRVSYMALNGFKKDTGKGFSDMTEDMPLEAYESLLFHALRSGHIAEDLDMPFKKEQMEEVLDECFMEFMELVPKFFPENKLGQTVGKPQKNRSQRRAGTPKK